MINVNAIRFLKVKFIKDLQQKRFNISTGETWLVRPDRITVDGFELGRGFVSNDSFDVVGVVRKLREPKAA